MVATTALFRFKLCIITLKQYEQSTHIVAAREKKSHTIDSMRF